MYYQILLYIKKECFFIAIKLNQSKSPSSKGPSLHAFNTSFTNLQ